MFILHFIYNLIDFKILQRYLGNFSTQRRWNYFTNNTIYLCCVMCLSIINTFNNPNYNLVCCIVCILFFSLTFKNPLINSLLLLGLYFGLGFVAEPIGFLLIQPLADNALPLYYSYGLSMAFSLFVRFALIEITIRYRKLQIKHLPINITISLLLISATGIFECCTAIWLAWHQKEKLANIYGVSVIIGVLLIHILLFWVLEKYQILFEHMHHNDLLLQEAQSKEAYYHEIEASNYEIRKIRHDLKNRLLGIVSIQDTDRVCDKIYAIIDELETVDKRIYTNNTVVNTILSAKIGKALKSGIKCNVNVLIPEIMNMDYGDAGILYGNLLDNSIEACEKLPQENRWINIKIVYHSNMLFIKISNSVSPRPDTQYVTSTNHGFGLKSVQRIVEKYNGTIDILKETDSFEITAVLYGIKAKQS